MSVLNVPLYNALARRFGEVKISKPGEQAEYAVPETVGRPMPDARRPRVQDWGEVYQVCCPFCNETRFRLNVSHIWGSRGVFQGVPVFFGYGWAICFNETKCNTWGLSSMIKVDPSDRNPIIAPMVVEQKLTLPAGRPINNSGVPEEARQYLMRRNFDLDELAKVGVSYSTAFKDPRIVFPIYEEAKLVGWQARYIGTPPDKTTPRYLSARGMRKTRILYNLDGAVEYPGIILVEGILDALRVGPCGVALFGKVMSTDQFAKVWSYWKNGWVVLVLDRDAAEEATRFEKMCNLYGGFRQGAHVLRLPDDRDPADYSRPELWAKIKEIIT